MMIDLSLAREQLNQSVYAEPGHKLGLVEEARGLFRRAYLRGKLAGLWSKLSRRSTRLHDLAAVEAGQTIISRHNGGIQTVPVYQIQGSEGRSQDFDRDFNPRQPHTEDRWLNIALAWLNDIPLPSVQLIRVGDVYFVRDGHHRVSVARSLGQHYIDAEVTIWEVAEAGQTNPAVSPAKTKGNYPSPLPVFQPCCQNSF